jgi:hypothetical protein
MDFLWERRPPEAGEDLAGQHLPLIARWKTRSPGLYWERGLSSPRTSTKARTHSKHELFSSTNLSPQSALENALSRALAGARTFQSALKEMLKVTDFTIAFLFIDDSC